MLDLLKVGPEFTRPACRVTATHIDQYLLPARPTPAVNQLVVAAAIDRQDRHMDGQTLDRLMTLTAYYADHLVIQTISTPHRIVKP